jgi:2-phosphoglycerate kinase
MITIKYKDRDTPFVKDMFVASLTRAGMKPWQAYSFAGEVHDELLAKGIQEITSDDFADLVYNRLKNVSEKTADRYKAWRNIGKGEREPFILLLGGGTGVGTTSVGTELAHRMGIKNIIATDSIREVMRRMVSEKLLPVLHSSSYDAHKYLNIEAKKNDVLMGFQMQTAEVTVGIEAIIGRALKEGTPTMIEGLHVVPGYISKEYMEKPNILTFVLHLKDEKEHRNRFYARALETKFHRPVEAYMENFDSIRQIQDYVIKKAKENNVEVIENTEIEKTITELMDRFIDAIIKQGKREGG